MFPAFWRVGVNDGAVAGLHPAYGLAAHAAAEVVFGDGDIVG